MTMDVAPDQDEEAKAASPPMPGRPTPESSTGRPIMAALHLLSRRWVLRVIWELRHGPVGFRDMQARCDRMSPNTLSNRLAELRSAGIADRDASGDWELTPLGRRLRPALTELQRWSDEWADSLNP